MSLFDKRIAFKPFEYPEILEYKDAISHSFWLVSEWNFLSDIHDFNVNLTPVEKNAIKNALLAISQIEVSVKKFWAKLGDRFPKSEFDQVGITFGECFIDGTEILTPSGWINLSEIKVNDDVVQYHPDNTFSFTKVRHKYDKDYSGDLIRFYKKDTETFVTPNHRMLYYDADGQYSESFADNFDVTNKNNLFPEAGKLIGGKEDQLTLEDQLRIAIHINGKKTSELHEESKSTYNLEISMNNVENMDWILENIYPKIDFTKTNPSDNSFKVCYNIVIDNKFDYEKLDWIDLSSKTHNWCNRFINEILRWNPVLNSEDCSFKIYPKNKESADIIQTIGIFAGYKTNLISRCCDNLLTVCFYNQKDKEQVCCLKKEIIQYDGPIRCVTVDSGAIITRINGKTFICGQSEVRHADAYSHLLQVLGLNDDFNELLQNPVIQGRIEYLTKYLKGASDNSNENYTLTLTLFSIFIENVSLFSQFLIIKSFNKYKNILKDIDNIVQATIKEECYAEADVLTPSGWKALADIETGDPVYQFNKGNIEPVTVLHKTKRNYVGDVYEIESDYTNCLVTPNHDMVYYDQDSISKRERAKDINYNSEISIPTCGALAVKGKDLTWDEKLRIAIEIMSLKEKTKYSNDVCSINLTEENEKTKIKEIFSYVSCGLNETQNNESTLFEFKHSKPLKSFSWVNLSEKSFEWCCSFIQELIKWDNKELCLTDCEAVDKIQAIATLAGYIANISVRNDEKSSLPVYRINFVHIPRLSEGSKFKKSIAQYNGMVYCVTVPSGVIITRRKGKICIAGNCLHAMLGVYIIKQIRKEFPDWFTEAFYAKLQRACKKAYDAEEKIVDWIFEAGELDFLPKDNVKEFLKQRFNESLEMLDCKPVFEIDQDKISTLKWFNDEIHAEVNTDFFHKKPVTYSKKTKAIRAEDLF